MRSKHIPRAVPAAVAAGLALSAALPATPAAAAATAVALPVAHYSHMLVDPVHRHLFISSGSGSSTILVTDFSGRTVATVPGEAGATGLALSPDGSTVYAALAGGDAVSAISTATLAETARYATGTGTQPAYVACAGGRIWFGYGGAGRGGIGSIDPAAGTVALKAAPGFWYAAPMLAAGPGGVLAAGEPGQSPDQLATYSVSAGTAGVLASEQFVMSAGNMRDLAVTPDGQEVVTASGSPYQQQVFKASDLSAAGQYDTAAYPDAVAITAEGAVLAGVDNPYGDTVYAFAPGNANALRTYTLPSGTPAPAGLAVTPDGSELFAVTTDVYGGNPVLDILPDPAQTASTLTLAGPAQVHPRARITLTGSLGGLPPYTAGQALQVTRIDRAHPSGVRLRDVVTAADGSFRITDRPRARGPVTYRVSYAGGPYLAASSATAVVQVGKAKPAK